MNFPVRLTALCLLITVFVASCGTCLGQGTATPPGADEQPFAPFEQWKDLILKGDAAGLKDLYSTHPVAQIKAAASDLDAAAEIQFWIGIRAKTMNVDILRSGSAQVQPGSRQIFFQAEIQSAADPKEQTFYLTEGQLWQQQDQRWRMVVAKRTDPSRLKQPASNQKNIYPSGVDAHAEIQAALKKGGQEHKRILIVFGANWCYDCHVLDLAFDRPDIAPVVGANFEVVHVDVGQGDKNQDLMKEYDVPMDRGIPALAVLDGAGKLLYSQKNGEFEKARSLGPEDLLAFLNKWRAHA
jgi:thioredoxin 1